MTGVRQGGPQAARPVNVRRRTSPSVRADLERVVLDAALRDGRVSVAQWPVPALAWLVVAGVLRRVDAQTYELTEAGWRAAHKAGRVREAPVDPETRRSSRPPVAVTTVEVGDEGGMLGNLALAPGRYRVLVERVS